MFLQFFEEIMPDRPALEKMGFIKRLRETPFPLSKVIVFTDFFLDSTSVNEALKSLAKIMKKYKKCCLNKSVPAETFGYTDLNELSNSVWEYIKDEKW